VVRRADAALACAAAGVVAICAAADPLALREQLASTGVRVLDESEIGERNEVR
jgi:hypothetical protein